MATQVAVNYRLRPKYYEKLLFLFETYAVGDPHLTRSEIAQLQADEQALYSITPAQDANTMSRLCANLPGMRDLGRKPVITDGCACVGGNVMSFALSGAYAQVNAVEFDESRARMLEHNVNVIRGRAPCTVNIVTGSYIALMYTLSQDIVFLDPPWGGPDYKDLDTVSLSLGDKHLADIVHDLHVHRALLATHKGRLQTQIRSVLRGAIEANLKLYVYWFDLSLQRVSRVSTDTCKRGNQGYPAREMFPRPERGAE